MANASTSVKPIIPLNGTSALTTPTPSYSYPASLEPEHESDTASRTLSYVFVPLGAVAVVLIVTALILLLVRKRRLDRLRHHLMPLYNFDATEGDEEDWEAELLEDSGESQSLRRGYKSMEFPTSQATSRFY